MTSRRKGIRLFSSLYKIVRSELAADSPSLLASARPDTLHVPETATKQLINLRNFTAGPHGIYATSAKEAISDVAKVAKPRRCRAAKSAKEEGKACLPTDSQTGLEKSEATYPPPGKPKPKRTRSRRFQTATATEDTAASSPPSTVASRRLKRPDSKASSRDAAARAAAESSSQSDQSSDPHAAAASEAKPAVKRSRRRVQQVDVPTPAAAISLHLPSYQQLKRDAAERQGVEISSKAQDAIQDHIAAFRGSAQIQDQALALYVNAKLFNTATDELESFLLDSITPKLAEAFMACPPGKVSEEALFGLFAEYAVSNYSQELQTYRKRVQSVDMRQSHLWYPVARALDRKIIYHAGPTNSGKTYNALKAMKEAQSGLYCGPLRLLAMEVYDTINQEGIFCNLHTGQERQEIEGARHASCTIEMINTTKHWHCAVLDEIQMIGDDQRGWAWTRALQGLPANEIHLCGDASALPLVRQMCETMGETLTVCKYDRFTPLEIEPAALPHDYASVRPGDCIVAFSRRDIFDIKALIERRTGHKCCVIYGALPPEMRRHQAALFNDPHSGFDVLVASDAVGMGLNLNIGRIIFHKVKKFEGKPDACPVSPSAIKQIAGRAGRRNSLYPKGYVGTHNPADLAQVTEAVNMPLTHLSTPAAGLFPEFQHIELLAGQVPNDSFGSLLERFSNEAKLEGTFFFCRQDGVMQVAKLLEKVDNLSLEDRFDFCMAPAQLRDSRQAAALLHFAARYANGMPVTLDINIPRVMPVTAEQLRHMEATHQVISLWIWLSHRFGSHAFPGLEKVMEQSESMVKLMNEGLECMSRTNKRGGRRRLSKSFPEFSFAAALLQKQEPLASAYLADSKSHRAIYHTEWAEPAAAKTQAALM